MPELPRPVQLIAEAPHSNVVRLGRAVGDTSVRQCGSARVVGVLEEPHVLGQASGAEVDREHGLDAGLSRPPHELVESEIVGRDAVPGQIEPRRPFLAPAHPVLPGVARDEAAARVAHHADPELAHQRTRRVAVAREPRRRPGGRQPELSSAGSNRSLWPTVGQRGVDFRLREQLAQEVSIGGYDEPT